MAILGGLGAESVWIVKPDPQRTGPEHKSIAIKARLHGKKAPSAEEPIRIAVPESASWGIQDEVRARLAASLGDRGFVVHAEGTAGVRPDLVLHFSFGTEKVEYDGVRPSYDAEIHGQRFRFEMETPPRSRAGKVSLYLHHFRGELIDESARPSKRRRWDGLAVLGDVLTRDPAWTDDQARHLIGTLAERVARRFLTDWRAIEVMDAQYESGLTLKPRRWEGERLDTLLGLCKTVDESVVAVEHDGPGAYLHRAHLPHPTGGQVVVLYRPAVHENFGVQTYSEWPVGSSTQETARGDVSRPAIKTPKRIVARLWVDAQGVIERSWVDQGQADPCLLQLEYERPD